MRKAITAGEEEGRLKLARESLPDTPWRRAFSFVFDLIVPNGPDPLMQFKKVLKRPVLPAPE
jgi:hypothetical protein